jgi:hypothetical protein
MYYNFKTNKFDAYKHDMTDSNKTSDKLKAINIFNTIKDAENLKEWGRAKYPNLRENNKIIA